jgi:hypothetical protein
MTQLIGSYHYDVRKLGPANAKGRLNQLFDQDEYAIIRRTQDRLAYQLYLLACDYIMEHFKAADRQMLKQEGVRLTPANYVKSVKFITDLLHRTPKKALKLAQELPIAEAR